MAIREHSQGDCSSDLILPGNFPFGTPESARYSSLDSIHVLLQASKSESSRYLNHYSHLYHASIPIFDLKRFHTEIERYWEAADKLDFCWLAQYLAVLGLGAFATSRDEKLAADFFFASEACLARTPYMYRPSVANIRTLCLLVVAKQVAFATCWALDSCWNIMGLIVRLSLMTTLHQDYIPGCDIPGVVEERILRRRLWNIVVYLDIQMGLITGQTSPLPHDALLTTVQPSSDGTADHCWDSVLPTSFPIICHFLARINSSIDVMTYDEVLQYDLEVRQSMRHAAAVGGSDILSTTVDIFFRRVLLVLHRRHALDPEAPTLYPTSYWSSLECSLALIIHQRELSDDLCSPHDVHLIGRPFMLDFFAAALTTCIHLLRTDAPLAATLTSEGTIPPRQTIMNTLRSCLDLFAKEQHRSVCFRSGYHMLSAVYGLIPRE